MGREVGRRIPAFILCLLAAACAREGSVSGQVTAAGEPPEAATVELYLEAGREKRTSPFATAYADRGGAFRLTVPAGSYHLVARGESRDGVRLYGEYPGNPVGVSRGADTPVTLALEAAAAAREMTGPPDSGITGKGVAGEAPAAGGYVYVYQDDRSGLRGPGYLAARRLGADGSFRVQLPPGRYWVALRRKADGEKAGFVGSGDLTGVFPGNPVEVRRGGFTELGTVPLHPADREKLDGVSRSRRERGGTGISGRVEDAGGKPVAMMQVVVYHTPQMTGRPRAVAVTDPEGAFSLTLEPGTYYLGARQNRSGPRKPGELAGLWDGSPDHAVVLQAGAWREGLLIRVEEVW